MKTIECYGGEVKVRKLQKFFRMGFIIKSEKVLFDVLAKPLFIFNAYRERFYLGSIEFEASSLKSAKKKLDRWLLNNFPDEFEFNPPYENSYRFNMYNYKMRIHYVNKIIRDKGEKDHKFCPYCSHKNYSEARRCRECSFLFVRG